MVRKNRAYVLVPQDKLDVEQDRRLEEHKSQLKSQIETQLQDEHRQRLDIQKERLAMEYNQELQRNCCSNLPLIIDHK